MMKKYFLFTGLFLFKYSMLAALCLVYPTTILAEEEQSATKKSASSLPLIGYFLDMSKEKKCQLRGYRPPYNKPPFNRHRYNQCLKKIRYLQNVDF